MARHPIDKRICESDPRDVKRFSRFDAQNLGALHPAIRVAHRQPREADSLPLKAYLRIARGHLA